MLQRPLSSGIYATTVATDLTTSTDCDYVPAPVGSVAVPLPKPIQSTASDVTKLTAFELIKRLNHHKVTEQDKLQALGYIWLSNPNLCRNI